MNATELARLFLELAEVYEEGGYWRWRIVDSRAREFVDGGNFSSKEDAANSLREALTLLDTARQAQKEATCLK